MAQLITIPLPDGTSSEAYLARPEGESPGERPGVLLFMDAVGLRPQIAAMADRIASWGYVVLAPNTFHRYGTAAETTPDAPLMTPELRAQFFRRSRGRLGGLFAAGNRERLLDDLRAYVADLHAEPGVSPGPIGITGYCMGARLALLTAGALGDGVAAAAGFHGGGLVTDDDLSPHRALAHATAEFWFGHADNDLSNTPEQQQALAKAMIDHGLVHGAAQYDGAAHGFTMADTANYHEPGAERHYRDLRSLLAHTLDTEG